MLPGLLLVLLEIAGPSELSSGLQSDVAFVGGMTRSSHLGSDAGLQFWRGGGVNTRCEPDAQVGKAEVQEQRRPVLS